MNFNVSFMELLRWRISLLENKLHQYRHSTSENVIVDTEYGKVKGLKRTTAYDVPYYSFEGIPYAQPPVGELRFKAPQRPTPWQGVKDCTSTKDKALQIDFGVNKIGGTEDCLYLNVYTNNLNPDKPRPVMVFIHGGGFIFGEANRDFYGPDYFMQKDVILVTIQYRLGVLGFLSLKTPELNVPGNAGLKDQVMALKWIKSNCASFGGNPDCITVFGQSAGGASTNYLMMTEQTQGLFQRSIMMAGNSLCPWASTDCSKRAFTIAKLAGYKGENNETEMLKFFMSVKAKDLALMESKVLTPEERQTRIMFAFGPTVEPYITSECVLPKHPREMLKHAWGNAIPTMLGYNSYEGLFNRPEIIFNPSCVKVLDTCVDFLPAELVTEDRKSAEAMELGLSLKKAHCTGEQPTHDDLLDLYSYYHMCFPMHRLILSRFAYAAGAPVYMYRFDFDSEQLINPYRIMRLGRGIKGVAHADELSYLFWTFMARRMPKESAEFRTIERVIGLFTQFAATGNPNDTSIDGMAELIWEPLKKSETVHKCLNISEDLKFIDLPEMEKLKVWQSLYDKKKELLY